MLLLPLRGQASGGRAAQAPSPPHCPLPRGVPPPGVRWAAGAPASAARCAGGSPARAGGHQRKVGQTCPHTHNFSGNSSSEAGLWLSPLCTAAAAGRTQDNAPPSPAWRSNDPPQPTATITGRFSSCTLFSFCDSGQRRSPVPQAYPLLLGRMPSLACPCCHPRREGHVWRPAGGGGGTGAAGRPTEGSCGPD